MSTVRAAASRMPRKSLRFLQSLVATSALGALGGCAASTGGADATLSDASREATSSDGAVAMCPNPRPADLTPCTNVGEECIVPGDPPPPDGGPTTPSGGSCRCEANGAMPVWRCYLAAGPQLPPELDA